MIEGEGPAEVCIVSTDLAEVVEVVISPVDTKQVDNSAVGTLQ